MIDLRRARTAWAIVKRSVNRLDGDRGYLNGTVQHPSRTQLFDTRREARKFIESKYGYWRNRQDLRAEPHGWKDAETDQG